MRLEGLIEQLETASADPVAAARAPPTLADLPEGAPESLVVLRKTWVAEREKISGSLDVDLQKSLRALEAELTRKRDFTTAQQVLAFRESLAGGASRSAPSERESAGSPKDAPAASESGGRLHLKVVGDLDKDFSIPAAVAAHEDYIEVRVYGSNWAAVRKTGDPKCLVRSQNLEWLAKLSDAEFGGLPRGWACNLINCGER